LRNAKVLSIFRFIPKKKLVPDGSRTGSGYVGEKAAEPRLKVARRFTGGLGSETVTLAIQPLLLGNDRQEKAKAAQN
jgi:hypothetical protein